MISEGSRAVFNTFQDRLSIEVIKLDKNSDSNNLIYYDNATKILTVFIPDLYDPSIAESLSLYFIDTLKNYKYKDIDNEYILLSGTHIDKAMAEVFTDGSVSSIVPMVKKFIDSARVKNIIHDYESLFNTLDLPIDKKDACNFFRGFITTALLHSWTKDVKYNYQIILSKFNKYYKPITFCTLLTVTKERLDYNLLHLLQIALNICYNGVSDILRWFEEQTKITDTKKEFQQVNGNKNEVNSEKKIVYASKVIQKVDYEITKVANTTEPVLLLGETGVGKDLIAYEIHKRSSRAKNPFVTVSINNLSESIIESELFGYEKGAFTGAVDEKIGKFESADRGTLYLPEISEIPHKIQLKLLEFFQYRRVERVGNKKNILNLDIRLILASNADLSKLLREGKLREDFYYRISVIKINIPPLRERKEDIRPLANYFLRRHSYRIRGEYYEFDEFVLSELEKYDWRGNGRQLENLIIGAIVKSDSPRIKTFAFEDLYRSIVHDIPLKKNGEDISNYKASELIFKKNYFKEILKKANGNITYAASIAGISRQALYKIINELDLHI